ncbi:lysozyme inhibitor LprI family protein [Pseudomonas oryzihabitans]|uniref:lysozyme inhibitor LprI family protein n=1 Tax=Pseudomonas oryzihabitans TaxID=47885 RepID=UPI002553FF0B|nr:lysozyme inhibitor LprI family protein [Pseudomonas oryzihabitans]MDK8265353.1 lysozyme inhibitor LprI family protein [Pseudomonas oryzihabitans]
MITCRLSALLALLLSTAALAAEQAPGTCDRQGSEAQLAACASQDLAVAEARLADVYGRRLAGLSTEQRPAFERLQRLWQDDRAPRCATATRGFQGAMQQLQYLSCLKSVTLLRLDDLQRQLPRRD